MLRAIAALVAAAGIAGGTFSADAGEVPLELDGAMKQGGLVRGRTEPGATVHFAGREVRVSSQGVFVIGFGRDAPRSEHLIVVLPDGRRIERTLEIARRDYDVQHIDGVPPRTVHPPESAWPKIRRDIRIVKEARRRDGARTDFLDGFAWPLEGRITGLYGSQRVYNGTPRRPHYGVDIAAPAGTPVRAPAAGVVTVAEPDMYFSGGTVLLDHGHGLSSAFLHMRTLYVDVGDTVGRGEALGEVGAAGRATGPHLDWRINWFSRRLDPRLVAGPMP